MDGIIEVKVNGHSISKDNTCAGAQFEENSTKLRISFGNNWSGFAKTITFWNALGENPVKRMLTVDLLENAAESTSIYIVPIPGEAMTEAGRMTFVIDGYIDGVRKRTVKDTLSVLPSERDDDAGEPQDPTPTQAEQLQGQMESVIGDLQKAEVAMQEINKSIPVVEQYAKEAEESAEKAEESVGKTSYIGDDNYWYTWDSTLGTFVNTGVSAEGKTGIHIGPNPPTDPEVSVWIDDDGSAYDAYASLITEGEGKASIVHKGWDYDESPEYRNTVAEGALNGVALGGNNHITGGNFGMAVNSANTVGAGSAFAANYMNSVYARYGFVANSGNTIEAEATSAFVGGHHNKAVSPYQVVFGTYADAGEDDRFVIGCGSGEENRKNLFKVTKTGKVVSDSFEGRNVVLNGKLFTGSYGDLKDKPFNYSWNRAYVTALKEQDVAFTSNGMQWYVSEEVLFGDYYPKYEMEPGLRYKATIDGKEYSFTCGIGELTGDGHGGEYLEIPCSSDDPVCPYSMYIRAYYDHDTYEIGNRSVHFSTRTEGTSHRIKVVDTGEVLLQLDEKFIPKSIARVQALETIKTDVAGLQQQINEEAHFRGYLSSNAKIKALEATPNDFAYSAESGTKWVYDAEAGWVDTGTPVPDQLTPASDATPLVNGVATAGQANEYARGDHRHPTDTTRVSVEDFNTFKSELETGLDNIIAIQNALIGGGSV